MSSGVKSWNIFVGGKTQPPASARVFEVVNPKDGSAIATVAEGDQTDINAAVKAAQEAFTAWAAVSISDRCAVMLRIADILDRRLDEFVSLEIDQTGRPWREMKAQLARLPEWFRYFGSVARTHEDTSPPFDGNYLNYTRRVPLGVVGLVTPWNHPLLILTKKVAPAMAAGNTMVVKPSELAPITPLLLAEVFSEAGVPAGVYNVVPGFGATAGAALTQHPGIRKIDVTGGTETGKTIASLAGNNLTRVAAELGGKASVVVFADSDVDRSAAAALFAAFIATGQTCIQGSRLLVHRSIHDDVVEVITKRVKAIRLGDPCDPSTQMGPLISAHQRDRTEQYVASALKEGATLAAGGKRPAGAEFERGFYYLPTVFTGVTSSMRVAQEEIFGPVLCVIPFDTEEEAVALANDTEFGLATSIWSNDITRAHRVAHRMQSGIVWINDHHRIDPSSPWGGFKMSGLGRENGLVAYRSYTQLQNVIVNLSDDTFDWYADASEQPLRYS